MDVWQLILFAEESAQGWSIGGDTLTVGGALLTVITILWALHVSNFKDLKTKYETCEKDHKEKDKKLLTLTERVGKVEGQFEGLTSGMELQKEALSKQKSWVESGFEQIAASVDQVTQSVDGLTKAMLEGENSD